MLKNQNHIKIIMVPENIKNTIKRIGQLKPDIILLDPGLRNRNSLTKVEAVKKDFPDAKVIIMDLAPVLGDINLFIKAGASGFILKNASPDDFLETIRTVAEGANILPPNLTDSLFSRIANRALKGGKVKLKEAVRMTKREREIIGLIADGLSNKEIGQKLSVSDFKIKNHVHNIMEKLALHTSLEVADCSTVTLKKIVKHISIAN